MKKLLLPIIFLFDFCMLSNAQNIASFAGNGLHPYSGDGGQASLAEIYYTGGIAEDASGNIYIADTYNNRIRKVKTTGVISTYAGTGTSGFSGDGGNATAAKLNLPYGLTLDASGNLYIADTYNGEIRKVGITSPPKISAVAGRGGTLGFSGDGGNASAAELYYPADVKIDGSNNLYIADSYNNCVRKVNGLTPTSTISTFAGTGGAANDGFTGDGGQATAAKMYSPEALSLDGSGNVYIADALNDRVRVVNSSGIISTFAGISNEGYAGNGGQATAAEIGTPYGLALDGSGNIYIADAWNSVIRKVNISSGIISTFAGTGYAGYAGDGGAATSAELNSPLRIYIDQTNGKMYIPDQYNNRVRIISNIIPLPIVLDNFTANYIEEKHAVLIDWTVSSQLNNKEYTVQKTVDGINYMTIATVAGDGTNPFTKSYSATDNNPTSGFSYYRLQQTDYDGNSVDFPPVPVFIGATKNSTVNLFPNPVTTNATFTYSSTDLTPLAVNIYDMTGNVLSSFTLSDVKAGLNSFSINTSALRAGVYFLHATGATQQYNIRFYKQ